MFGFTIDALTDNFLVLWRKELAGSHPDAIEDSIIVEYFGLDL